MNSSEYVTALQRVKGMIGFFANGDGSPVAESAKRLWSELDREQQQFEKKKGEPDASGNDKRPSQG